MLDKWMNYSCAYWKDAGDLDEAQESRINYQILLDNALMGIYVSDKHGNIIYANQTLSNMTGFSPAELLKMNFSDFIHPDDVAELRERIKSRISGQTPQEHYIHRVLIRSGAHRQYEIFSSRISIAGEPAILGVLQDITERLENERLIRESEEKYRNLITSMCMGFALHEVITDKAGKPVDYRFLEVNAGFEKMTGLKAQNIIGRTVLEVLPNIEPIWIEKYGKIALSGEPEHFTEYSRELGKYYEVHAYSPNKGQFAVTFTSRSLKDKVIRGNA